LYNKYQKNEVAAAREKGDDSTKEDPSPELYLEDGFMEVERPVSDVTTTPFYGDAFNDMTMRSEMSELSEASSMTPAPENSKSFMMVGQSEMPIHELPLPVSARMKSLPAKPWLRLNIFGKKSAEEEQSTSAVPDTPVSFNMDALESYRDLPAMYADASGERSPPPMMDLPLPPTNMLMSSDAKPVLKINTQAARLSMHPNRVSFAAKNQTAVFSPASTFNSFASSPLAKERSSLSSSEDEVRVVSGAYSTVSIPISDASEDDSEAHVLATSPCSPKNMKDAFEIADNAKAFAEKAVYYSPRFSGASIQSFGSSL
jgi:hypothetical protein